MQILRFLPLMRLFHEIRIWQAEEKLRLSMARLGKLLDEADALPTIEEVSSLASEFSETWAASKRSRTAGESFRY